MMRGHGWNYTGGNTGTCPVQRKSRSVSQQAYAEWQKQLGKVIWQIFQHHSMWFAYFSTPQESLRRPITVSEIPQEFYGASDDAALLATCGDKAYAWIKSLTEEVREANARIDQLQQLEKELRIALEESVTLQAHYAKQLNIYDGGHRLPFKCAEDWIARLREMGTIK